MLLRAAGFLEALIRGWKYDWKVAMELEMGIRDRVCEEYGSIGRDGLRRSHVLAAEYQLAELKADLGVVDSRGDHG